MSSPEEESRAEKIKRVLQRRAFLDAHIPEHRETLVDFRRLFDIARERAKEYRTAEPFPYIVIDDFLPPESLATILDAMPRLDDEHLKWGNLNANLPDGRPAQASKYHLQNVLSMKAPLRQLIAELNSGPFTFVLAELTGIEGLLVDAQLLGGGIHLVKPGGLLRVHADFRRHLSYNLERRLNLLLYLNPDWREEYGGHLEIWDREMKACARSVLPIANRCVIFNTTDDSYHGHPHPLTCPEGMLRRSLALYYYTADRPSAVEANVHATAWQETPEEKTPGRSS
jgi:Rps23 Pro-64 3,4-dihydroxylase Tpa1-like proline 4-hydroxylase